MSLIHIFISDYWQSRSSWFTVHISRKILTMHFHFAIYCFILSTMHAFISDHWKYLSSCLSMRFLSWILKFAQSYMLIMILNYLNFLVVVNFLLVLIPASFSDLWQRSLFLFYFLDSASLNYAQWIENKRHLRNLILHFVLSWPIPGYIYYNTKV